MVDGDRDQRLVLYSTTDANHNPETPHESRNETI